MMKALILTIALIKLIANRDSIYEKIIVEQKDALCLDGSFGVYYISQGQSKNKFMIYFQGGGWCTSKDEQSSIQDCYARSKTSYGSSTTYPQYLTYSDGILSRNPKNYFKDFTKIYFKYCDGFGHIGTRQTPVSYNNTNLYFRGNNLTVSKLDHLQQNYKIFSNSTQILVTGGSAGGLAAFMWVDYIRNRSNTKNVYAIPDGGIFIDSPHIETHQNQYRKRLINIFKLSNAVTNSPLSQCIKAIPKQPYMCMLVQHLHKYIKSPIFPVQSMYDSWSIQYILGIECSRNLTLQKCNTHQRAYIQRYHKNMSKVLKSITSKQNNGCWASNCIMHTYFKHKTFYSEEYTVPQQSRYTINNAIQYWRKHKSRNNVNIDEGSWPSNMACSKLSEQGLLRLSEKSLKRKLIYFTIFVTVMGPIIGYLLYRYKMKKNQLNQFSSYKNSRQQQSSTSMNE